MAPGARTRSNRFAQLIDFILIAVMIIGLLIMVTYRHGWSVWNTVIRLGWPILSASALIGLLGGFVRWRWLGRSQLGQKGLFLLSLGVGILLALDLMRRIALSDVWLGCLVIAIQTSLIEIVGAILTKRIKQAN